MLDRTNHKIEQAQAKTQRGTGIVKGNPRLCFYCRQPIRKAQAWTKQTSPDGAYSIIVHDRCKAKG